MIHSSGPQWQALGGQDRDWLADQSFSLTDDLDGSPADETVSFAFEGPSYEIDLSDPHAAELRDAAVAYIASARKVSSNVRAMSDGRSERGRGRSRADGNVDPKAVCSWASADGIDVNPRRRISAEVIARF